MVNNFSKCLSRTEGVHLPPKTSDSASFAAGHEAQPYVGVSKPAPVFLNQGSNGQEWPVSIPYNFTEGVKPLPYKLFRRTEGVHLPPNTSASASFAAGRKAQPHGGFLNPPLDFSIKVQMVRNGQCPFPTKVWKGTSPFPTILFLRLRQASTLQIPLIRFPNYPFTAPAIIPRTKYFCSAKKTIIGRSMERNAAAVSRCQPAPSEVTMLLI